jgi:hypothetical protein
MVLVLFLATGRGFDEETYLSLVDLNDPLDLFWREMVDCALFGFLPA